MSFLVAALFFCGCSRSNNKVTDSAEQTKMKLLKHAGFDNMDKTFSYDYTVQNDSAVGLISMVPSGSTISLTTEESAKGKLLNVFGTGDGHQYKTILMMRGASFVARIVSIDGIVFEENIYQQDDSIGGTPPFLCDNECTERCLRNCTNYFTRSIYPRLQEQANETCKPVFYCMACPLGPTPCVFILYCIRPQDSFCRIHVYDPVDIATRKMGGRLVVKNSGYGK